jgi:hypothetical protein
MASTILSDNGVSSGSAGIKTTADSTGALALQTTTAGGAATTAMTIDTSQNVGIGTTSPSEPLTTVTSSTQIARFKSTSASNNNAFVLETSGSASSINLWMTNTSAGTSSLIRGGGTIEFNVNGTGTSRDSPTRAGLFDLNGQLILKRAAAVNAATIVCSTGQNSRQVSFINNNNNNEVGYIFCNNDGTTTQYATTSDYRLKENIAPMTGALSVVEQLKPVTYKWKINGADGQGFIAHELQAVVPDCVTGEKDAVETYTDDDGNEQTRPKYQGIDTSFLVATLTAAIQELNAKFEEYKASHP